MENPFWGYFSEEELRGSLIQEYFFEGGAKGNPFWRYFIEG